MYVVPSVRSLIRAGRTYWSVPASELLSRLRPSPNLLAGGFGRSHWLQSRRLQASQLPQHPCSRLVPAKRGRPLVRDCPMLVDDFWQIVELSRSDADITDDRFDADAIGAALTERLSALSLEDILGFDELYFEASRRLQQWELCAACFLISGHISDDTFNDFKAGVIAMGRAA